jgi:CheY-specific phosphatase CheX
MLKSIEEAAQNFCLHQLQKKCILQEEPLQDQAFIAYIDVEANAKTSHRIFLISEKSIIQEVAQLFLEEQESDDETLQDMLLETTNLIIGSAKVIAQEKNESFDIQTPHFYKYGKFDETYDQAQTFVLDDGKFSIALRELHA